MTADRRMGSRRPGTRPVHLTDAERNLIVACLTAAAQLAATPEVIYRLAAVIDAPQSTVKITIHTGGTA